MALLAKRDRILEILKQHIKQMVEEMQGELHV